MPKQISFSRIRELRSEMRYRVGDDCGGVHLYPPKPRLADHRGRKGGASLKWEKKEAKIDAFDGVTDADCRCGGNRTDRKRPQIAAAEPERAAAPRGPDRPPPAARRSGAIGEKPERSERPDEQGRRRARPQDQE